MLRKFGKVFKKSQRLASFSSEKPPKEASLITCPSQLRPYAHKIWSDVREFVNEECIPLEPKFLAHEFSENRWNVVPEMEELKAKAKSAGLWNLFVPFNIDEDLQFGRGLTNLEYAFMAEEMGRCLIGSEPFNCSPPDTGNMEVLIKYGTEEQKSEWLEPLLDGKIRSCFGMTEIAVASSDATNIESSITSCGDDYVLNGRKWWTSMSLHPNCELCIFMGKTDFSGRLGPGRIHHCMRLIGNCERSIELMKDRLRSRVAFGKKLSEQGVWKERVGLSRVETDQARLMTLLAAHKMDTVGAKVAAKEIAMIKIIAPNVAQTVVDRAIQAHGAAGMSSDFPLATFMTWARSLRLADGPDEVHVNSLAKLEMKN
ncbi:unnamed protein product [Oikopleura dioica]|uniref:Acyl-CoA dehydrogenase n=1 Tax=Oikopleura dioica TaxID=34765 RepID=E4YBX8_OIKDI|nr:unnamed protein product [Oikopleura dioica]